MTEVPAPLEEGRRGSCPPQWAATDAGERRAARTGAGRRSGSGHDSGTGPGHSRACCSELSPPTSRPPRPQEGPGLDRSGPDLPSFWAIFYVGYLENPPAAPEGLAYEGAGDLQRQCPAAMVAVVVAAPDASSTAKSCSPSSLASAPRTTAWPATCTGSPTAPPVQAGAPRLRRP